MNHTEFSSSIPAENVPPDDSRGIESRKDGNQESWLDQEVAKPFDEVNKASKLCSACLPFFTYTKEPGKSHRQFRFRSSLIAAVGHGCHLCAFLWNKIQLESCGVELPEELHLTYWLTTDLSFGCELHVFFQVYRSKRNDEKFLDSASAVLRFTRLKDIMHMYGEVNGSDTASAAVQKCAMQWFDECNNKHIACNHPKTRESWMPTRLVFIGSPRFANYVQIVETNTTTLSQDYIALSHCWGTSSIYTLTTANLNKSKAGIPVTLLPKNFRDAIEIATWFGVNHLWIDSLCILQDSPDDWIREAVTMKNVYKNALITIAATGASDSSIGCFSTRDPCLIKGFEIPTSRDGQPSDTMHCLNVDVWADGVIKAPLNQRAWVVQERLLSRRVLHFGAQQVYWECHELDACEAYPRGFPYTIRNYSSLNHFKDISSIRKVTCNTDGLRIVTHYEQWQRVIEAYTRSNLTKSTDKLIALSGIAAEMEILYKDEYLAGLWRRYLPEMLMWQVSWEDSYRFINSHLASRSPSYRAPSWSWLSVDGPIEGGTAHDNPVFIEILDAKIDHEVDRIKGGYIRLRGVLTEANVDVESDGQGMALVFGGQEEQHAVGYLDDKLERPPSKIACLPIKPGWYSARYDETIEVKGLLLHPTGSGDAEYKRIGWFSAEGPEVCELIEQGPRTTTRYNEVYESGSNRDNFAEIGRQTFEDGARDNLHRHLPTTILTLV